MGKHFNRLLLAAILSASGALATWQWYQSTKKVENDEGDRKPIARLAGSLNEVQRKPTKRLIWETIHDNENLYSGEAIRTAGNAEARIEFIKSGTAIDLDPDSVIVLEENQGQVALDFVKGNLFVRNGGVGGDNSLTLKTAKGSVALGKSEVALGKDSSGKLDLQVLKGSVSSDGKTLSDQNAGLKLIRPQPGEPVFINPVINELVLFEWAKLTAEYDVFVESGSKREKLSRIPGVTIKGNVGRLGAPLAIGKFYWRLIAIPSKAGLPELTTPVFRTQILAKIPPLLLEPERDVEVVLNPENPQLFFRWANPSNLKKLVLEVAKTPDMKTKALPTQSLDSTGAFAAPLSQSGTYYWRVTGFLATEEGAKSEAVASIVQKFQLSVSKDLLPPILKTPKVEERIQYQQFIESGGLTLSWNPAPGVKTYKVLVVSAGQPAASQEVNVPFITMKTLKPGAYTWTVLSKGSKGEVSKSGEKRVFYLSETPELRWADGKDAGEFLYVTEKPTLGAQWERGPVQTTKYRARYLVQGAPEGSTSPWIPVKETTLKTAVPDNGIYLVTVEALDGKDIVLARALPRTVTVRPAPLLPAPPYASAIPKEILAQNNGHARVAWNPVPGGSQYVVSIRSSAGGAAKENRFTGGEGVLRSLLPGDYRLSIRTVDQWGRIGPEGEIRPVKVPETSGVRAPKIKNVNVR